MSAGRLGLQPIEIGKLAPDETALHVAAGKGAMAFGDALRRFLELPVGEPGYGDTA